MIFKYFTLNDTYRWVDILDDLLYNYNHSYQSIIKMKPIDVTEKNKNDVLLNIESTLFNPNIKNNIQLKVGDVVRVKLPKGKLQKKTGEKFSTKLYTVGNVKYGEQGLVFDQYELKDENNTKVKEQYILSQLQKVNPDNKNEVKNVERKRIDHLVKTARKNAIDFKDSKRNQRDVVEFTINWKKK
jgi:hypothetical protein